ncbi:MAG: Tetratricopeptide repeat protein [Bacteroidetes bacterium]|nr:Tetratricopeptide repeat protein [Bacteroidota bacterium]
MKLNKLIALAFILCSSFSKADEPGIAFDSANSAYAAGRYEQAIKLYEQVLESNKESAALYFNLGNAYFKTDNISAAILNYERAKKLDPDDEDIDVNLKIANQKTEDKIEAAPQLFLSQWENSITGLMNEREWSLLLICLTAASLAFFALYVLSQGKGWKQLGFFGGTGLMLFSVFTFFMAQSKYNSSINSDAAIITSATVTVTGSPSEKGTRLFVLHEGTKVKITQKENEWTEIKIANGNVGWVKSASLKEI